LMPMSLNCSLQWAYCSSPRWYMSMEPRWNDIVIGTPKYSEMNLSVSLWPRKITHGPRWVSAVKGRRLTNWAMARPFRTLRNIYRQNWTWLPPFMRVQM
jgi:hypothetical protein